MNGKIALIAVLTDDVPALVQFYQEVLEFEIKTQHGDYVEFYNDLRYVLAQSCLKQPATLHSMNRKVDNYSVLRFPAVR